jgi:hypothetical protein
MQLYFRFFFFKNSSLHVLGVHHAHDQEYHYCIGNRWYNIWVRNITPDDGHGKRPKHVELSSWNKSQIQLHLVQYIYTYWNTMTEPWT